jgi:hypothetical protein
VRPQKLEIFMAATSKPNKKKRIVPRPEKGRTLEEAMAVTNKKYAGTLAKLAK